MLILSLAAKSLRNRLFATVLTVVSIALSVALLLGVERVRLGARESFYNTISKTDLVVGARGGTVQLLLYTVFHMGSATNNISWASYEKLSNHPAVKWTIPVSLGDSHQGFRVVATNENFYKFYHFRQDKGIEFVEGKPSDGIFDVILGSEVAERLGYKMGQSVALTHGVTEGRGILNHDDKPFAVTGILKRTSTPLDRALFITLEGMEAIHIDWKDGTPPATGKGVEANSLSKEKLPIGQITSFLLGTKNRIDTLRLQREINTFEDEPMMAIVPGVTLSELWNTIGYVEEGLKIVTFCVVLVGFLGMLISIYNSLSGRRREMAILRSLGAGPWALTGLLVFESALLSAAGILSGTALVYMLLFVLRPWVEREFGFYLPIQMLSVQEILYLTLILCAGFVIGLLPAWKAYRNALVDGLTVRL
jgi:putative ABC transport system permease protein